MIKLPEITVVDAEKSPADFIHKLKIALKELRETGYG